MENNKINIVKILKDCPKGMKLNCTIYENVEFDFIDETPEAIYPIHCLTKTNKGNESLVFTCDGCENTHINAKCVIFPENKDTWEGFVPPNIFKDGDVVSTDTGAWIGITTGGSIGRYIPTYCVIKEDNTFETYFNKKDKWAFNRLATEEEKQKLFNAIKANGLQWNSDTKTLEKLVSDKFDINTLIPFESRVLVRNFDDQIWKPAIFGAYIINKFYYITVGGLSYKQLIPYKDNEDLMGTINDCKEYFKTWKE